MALHARRIRVDSGAALALAALGLFATFGRGGAETSSVPRAAAPPRLRRLAHRAGGSVLGRPKGGDFDPAEVTIGERLFLETRFAELFASHMTGPLNEDDN